MSNAVSFSRNIRPLFTAVDIEHMRRAAVALDDFAYMSDPNHAESVYQKLSSREMPPPGSGESSARTLRARSRPHLAIAAISLRCRAPPVSVISQPPVKTAARRSGGTPRALVPDLTGRPGPWAASTVPERSRAART